MAGPGDRDHDGVMSSLVALLVIVVVLLALGAAAVRARTARPHRAELVPADGGDPVQLRRKRVVVGRLDADLVILEPTVSAVHAELVRQRGHWTVRDRCSRNGTYVNQSRVEQRTLADGDRIQFARDGPTYVFRRPVGPTGPTAPPATG